MFIRSNASQNTPQSSPNKPGPLHIRVGQTAQHANVFRNAYAQNSTKQKSSCKSNQADLVLLLLLHPYHVPLFKTSRHPTPPSAPLFNYVIIARMNVYQLRTLLPSRSVTSCTPHATQPAPTVANGNKAESPVINHSSCDAGVLLCFNGSRERPTLLPEHTLPAYSSEATRCRVESLSRNNVSVNSINGEIHYEASKQAAMRPSTLAVAARICHQNGASRRGRQLSTCNSAS